MGWYAAVFHDGYHYYFGGSSGSYLNSILRLEKVQKNLWTWSHVGQMESTRVSHRVILAEDRFMVVGGRRDGDFSNMKNEACFLKNDGKFYCMAFSSRLYNYIDYPVLFLVDDNYGNCSSPW